MRAEGHVASLLRSEPKHLSFLVLTLLPSVEVISGSCVLTAHRPNCGHSCARWRGRAGPVSRWACPSAISTRLLPELLLLLVFLLRIVPCTGPSIHFSFCWVPRSFPAYGVFFPSIGLSQVARQMLHSMLSFLGVLVFLLPMLRSAVVQCA